MDPEPSFEEALEQLEQIVADLERGEPELSAALKKYERGVALLGRCQSELERAGRAVALLTGVDTEGNPLTTPFDAAATPPAGDTPRRRGPRGTPPDDESIPY